MEDFGHFVREVSCSYSSDQAEALADEAVRT